MVEYVGMNVEEALIPRLKFRIRFTVEAVPEQYFTILGGHLYLIALGREILVGRVYPLPERLVYHSSPTQPRTVALYCDLTPYQVEAIERFRGGRDLWLRLTLCVQEAERLDGLLTRGSSWITVRHAEYGERIKIARSEWVEEYLPKLGYKRVRLIEVPLLPEDIPDEFKAIVDGIEEAWRYFAMGEYGQTLTSCRIAIEALRNWFYNQGMKRVKQINQKQKTLPDFRKFTNSESLGRAMERIYEGLYELVSLGPHFFPHGISRPEAEHALMSTYSLANYVIKSALRLNQ